MGLFEAASPSRNQLISLKSRLKVPFEWYPYDTMANLAHLDRLLSDAGLVLERITGDLPVLDIGCGDGDLAFFLESLGYRVIAVDYEATNHNGLAGFRTLKNALSSCVEFHSLDLDATVELPVPRCGLALMLGALYHLRNPFLALDTLSRVAQYAVISTRLAGGLIPASGSAPLAYLVDEHELNAADDSNYWLFTEAGLRRLLNRTRWDIHAWRIFEQQDKAGVDSRVFALLRSRFGIANLRLLSGWHEPEESGWRWTERSFAAETELPAARTNPEFRALIFVHEELIRSGEPYRLRIRLNDTPLPGWEFSQPGRHNLARRLKLVSGSPVRLDFEASRVFSPDERDSRERAIIVERMSID
jgi:SAM-dependent methyltransferase